MQVKAPPQSPVERERTITFALLLAGKTSFYAFNQAPSWQSFPVEWFPGDTGPHGVPHAPALSRHLLIQVAYLSTRMSNPVVLQYPLP